MPSSAILAFLPSIHFMFPPQAPSWLMALVFLSQRSCDVL